MKQPIFLAFRFLAFWMASAMNGFFLTQNSSREIDMYFDRKTYIRTISTSSTEMKSDDATTIMMAGGTLYFIGCVGLFTNWNSYHIVDVASSVTAVLGLLTTCIGILLIENYRLFKAFALIGVALILAFGYAWIVHRSVP